MNNARRKQIASSLSKLQNARDMLKSIYDKEQAIYNSLPEDDEKDDISFDADDYFDNLEETISSLNEAISALESNDF